MLSRFTLGLSALFLTGSSIASAASCGTIASPTACSITVGGTVTYDFTNFNLVNAAASGGGRTPYQASDIAIDLATGGGTTGLLSFSKNPSGPTPGVVFFVNPGEAEAFTFSYDVTISPAAAGSVAFANPEITTFQNSNSGNGLASLQTVISGAPLCQVFTGQPSRNCTLPPNPGISLNPGNIISMNGNTGNASIGTFTNLWDASFTASTGTPEPGSFALIGLGFIALRFVRRNKA